jgi:ABC-type uncharacterized transport system involved in gliding motility auxiliary subunit
MVMNRTNKKLQSYINFSVLFLLIVLGNILSSLYYKRIDLTLEKRYTLSETSKTLAKTVKDKVYFKLYLDGASVVKSVIRNQLNTKGMVPGTTLANALGINAGK